MFVWHLFCAILLVWLALFWCHFVSLLAPDLGDATDHMQHVCSQLQRVYCLCKSTEKMVFQVSARFMVSFCRVRRLLLAGSTDALLSRTHFSLPFEEWPKIVYTLPLYSNCFCQREFIGHLTSVVELYCEGMVRKRRRGRQRYRYP